MELLMDRADRVWVGGEPPPPPKDAAQARTRLAVLAWRAARAAAAAALSRPALLDGDLAGLEPDELRDQWAADVYRATRAVYDRAPGDQVDLGAVYEWLVATGRWDKKRLAADVHELFEEGWRSECYGAYFAAAVRLVNKRLAYLAAADDLATAAIDTPVADLDFGAGEQAVAGGAEGLDATAAAAFDRAAADQATQQVAVAAEAVEAGLADLDRRHSPDRKPVWTGLRAFDGTVPGFDPGDLVVVAARPSVGKTAFAATVACNVASIYGLPVYFASLEMSRAAVGQRIAYILTGVGSSRLRAGAASAEERRAVGAARELAAGVPLWVDDTPGLRVRQIAGTARRLKRRGGLSLVVVDYLQLVGPADRRADRRQQVEQISRDLKHLAREVGVPVMALAQLNREVEGRQDPKPRMSDIREAGGIEQDADVIAMLWRGGDEPDDAPERRIGCAVVKQRNGPTGEFDLLYRKAVMRFEDMPPTR